jgi:O-antigen/teichoic acid export membrane protein
MIKKLKSGHWPIFLLSSLSSVGNLFLPILLVRLLTPEDIGMYKIFFLHLSAIPFYVMAGGPIHSVYFWVGKGREERVQYINAAWILTLLLSSLVLIIGLPLQNHIGIQLDLTSRYILVMLFTGLLTCPASLFTETSIAYGKSALGSIFETIFEITKAAGFIFIGWKYKSLSGIFVYFAVLTSIKFVVSSYLNHRLNMVSLKTDQEHVKKVFMYCLPISLSGLLGFFIDKIDLLLLSSNLDVSSFAYYSMGCLIVPPLYLLEMSVQKVLIPNLSKSYVAQDWKGASEKFRNSIRDIGLLIVPSIFGLVIFATPIVKILYTKQYLDSAIYLQIFAFSYLLLMIPHDSVARATGNTGWILKMYLFVTPISLIGAGVAAKYIGVYGVLIVTITIKFIPKFCGLKLSKDLMNWNWKEMFPLKDLGSYVLLCSLLGIGCFSVKQLFYSDIEWFLVCGTSFALLYLATIYFITKRRHHD